MKQGKVLLLLGLVILLAVTSIGVAGARELRIGFVSHQHDISDLFGQLEIGFRNRLDEEGVEYRLFQASPTASHRHDEMLDILENMAQLNLDYMVFGPTSLDQNMSGLLSVAEAGTKILMVDYEPPEELDPVFEAQVINWSIYNHFDMGYLTGEWVADYFAERGNMNPQAVILWGPVASEISIARGSGVIQGLVDAEDRYDGFQADIIYEGYANFQRELAYEETEKLVVAYPQVEVIFGINSNTGLGAMAALETEGKLDDVLVVGMGGQVDELEMIALGKIGVAVLRDPRDMGANSAQALILDLAGRNDEIELISYTALRVIDEIDHIRQWVPRDMLDIDEALKKYEN